MALLIRLEKLHENRKSFQGFLGMATPICIHLGAPVMHCSLSKESGLHRRVLRHVFPAHGVARSPEEFGFCAFLGLAMAFLYQQRTLLFHFINFVNLHCRLAFQI
jgi:hypothetical protein